MHWLFWSRLMLLLVFAAHSGAKKLVFYSLQKGKWRPPHSQPGGNDAHLHPAAGLWYGYCMSVCNCRCCNRYSAGFIYYQNMAHFTEIRHLKCSVLTNNSNSCYCSVDNFLDTFEEWNILFCLSVWPRFWIHERSILCGEHPGWLCGAGDCGDTWRFPVLLPVLR